MSENVVSENLFVGKFAVGKIVSGNLPSEKLSEKPPRPGFQRGFNRGAAIVFIVFPITRINI